ncbi:putative membrane protein [Orientia tsutsugamushi str. Karp]|nr:putative membrane protein [Orientia tsutsugamushi str. Karp]
MQEIMYNYILSVVSINNSLFIAHISTNILS